MLLQCEHVFQLISLFILLLGKLQLTSAILKTYENKCFINVHSNKIIVGECTSITNCQASGGISVPGCIKNELCCCLINPIKFLYNNRNQINKIKTIESCDKPMFIQSKFTNGKLAAPGQWPWMASIQYREQQTINFTHRCGAVIINDQCLLTAAHCVKDVAVERLRILTNVVKLNDIKKEENLKKINSIIIHKAFDSVTFENDIALIKLDKKLENQIYICFYIKNENNYFYYDLDFLNHNYNHERAIVIGWGNENLNENQLFSNDLRNVHLNIISNDECELLFNKSGNPQKIIETFICTDTEVRGEDSCAGFSGGPLMIEENDNWYLIGILSWSIGTYCGVQGLPNVYTRIEKYFTWIQENIDDVD